MHLHFRDIAPTHTAGTVCGPFSDSLTRETDSASAARPNALAPSHPLMLGTHSPGRTALCSSALFNSSARSGCTQAFSLFVPLTFHTPLSNMCTHTRTLTCLHTCASDLHSQKEPTLTPADGGPLPRQAEAPGKRLYSL